MADVKNEKKDIYDYFDLKGMGGKVCFKRIGSRRRGGRGINDSPDRIPISFLGRNRKYRLIYKLDKTERS